MAKLSTSGLVLKTVSKISRPGIHSKSKTSKLKTSKNYKKLNRGQGK